MCMSSQKESSDIDVVRPRPSKDEQKAWQVRDPMYAGRRESIGDARYVPGSGKVNLEWYRQASTEDREKFYEDSRKRREELKKKQEATIQKNFNSARELRKNKKWQDAFNANGRSGTKKSMWNNRPAELHLNPDGEWGLGRYLDG